MIHQLLNTRPKYIYILLKIYKWFVVTVCLPPLRCQYGESVRRNKIERNRIGKVSLRICIYCWCCCCCLVLICWFGCIPVRNRLYFHSPARTRDQYRTNCYFSIRTNWYFQYSEFTFYLPKCGIEIIFELSIHSVRLWNVKQNALTVYNNIYVCIAMRILRVYRIVCWILSDWNPNQRMTKRKNIVITT